MAKFQIDSTADEEISHRPQLQNVPAFGNVKLLPKTGIFLQWGSVGKTGQEVNLISIAENVFALGHETDKYMY